LTKKKKGGGKKKAAEIAPEQPTPETTPEPEPEPQRPEATEIIIPTDTGERKPPKLMPTEVTLKRVAFDTTPKGATVKLAPVEKPQPAPSKGPKCPMCFNVYGVDVCYCKKG